MRWQSPGRTARPGRQPALRSKRSAKEGHRLPEFRNGTPVRWWGFPSRCSY